MTVKQCPQCKTDNPSIYEHCIKCGAPLPAEKHQPIARKYLMPVVGMVLVILITVYVIIPALHLSVATGATLSAAIHTIAVPVPRYGINQPVQGDDLQVTVTQARAGADMLNGRLYTVSVSIQNQNKDMTYSIPASDFVLTDSSGNYYYSTGIGSRVSYDAQPGTTGTADLVYIVPQDADGLRVLYTFPSSSVLGLGRHEVAFVL